jgi:acid phosphatase
MPATSRVPLSSSAWFAAFALVGALLPAQSAVEVTSTQAAGTAGAPHEQTLALLWMQRAAEYKAACLQAYNLALWQLDEALRQPTWTACIEQVDPDTYATLPPAIVVDVDETVLDNSAFAARQVLAGVTTFDPAAWGAWVKEQQAAPIPGALAYLTAAAQRGVRVVYVTNRRADSDKPGAVSTEETDTRANLARFGFPLAEAPGEDLVLTAGEIGDKSARRTAVCKRFRVVQLVGDNLGDFVAGTEPRKGAQAPHGKQVENAATERLRDGVTTEFAGWWGSRWILIPNPAYGGWETVLRSQHDDLRAALRTQR